MLMMQVSGGLQWPINKLVDTILDGNVNEVGSKEDLVSALKNNMIQVVDLVA